MYSVKDSGILLHWVPPFGILRVKAISSSPKIIAGLRVLHRLLIPRHPPAALTSLTKNYFDHKLYKISYNIERLTVSLRQLNIYPQAPIFISDFKTLTKPKFSKFLYFT